MEWLLEWEMKLGWETEPCGFGVPDMANNLSQGLLVNNNNGHTKIKLDSLEAHYRDKVVNTGDEGGGDGSIAPSMKNLGYFVT